MAAPNRFELELFEDVNEDTECNQEFLGAAGLHVPPSLSNSLAGTIGDENAYQSQASSVPTSLCTNTAIKRPSYCNLEGNTGLYPAAFHFDVNVVKRLDTFFDETVTDILEVDEKLKTFLRIRPSTSNGAGPKSRSLKAQKNKVLEVKDATTVITYPIQKTVNSFAAGARVHTERNKKTEFQFTKVLGPECGQTVVFEECVNPLIDKFMRNENCLIFSYGATNSGKTYTLQGHGTDYGIIPRTLDAIFSRVQDRLFKHGDIKPSLYQGFHHLSAAEKELIQRKKEQILSQTADINNELLNLKANASFVGSQLSSQGSTVDLVGVREFSEMNYALFANTTLFSIWVSFAELYNEKVYDLLETVNVGKNMRRKELRLLQDKNGFVYIKDLTEFHVTSDDEAYKLFLAGRKNLQFAATQMNQRSSRSHSFFTLRVVSVGIGEGLMPFPKTVHRMTFCDLAGMERVYQTENEGARLKESTNINSSLTVLLKVIRLLREKQAQGHGMIETIPFRESKLTHIFKSYLTSSTHICMMVNVNPDPEMADSTLQVLHNSAIASNVIVFRPIEPVENKVLTRSNLRQKCLNDKENIDPEKKVPKPVTSRINRVMNSDYVFPDNDKKKKDGKKVKFHGFLSSSSSGTCSEDDEEQTIVAHFKVLQQRMAALEKENKELKMRLTKSELEKEQIREETVKLFAEQNRSWTARYKQCMLVEENVGKRKLSLAQQSPGILSPGNKCGRDHTPAKVHMEDILEDESEEGNSSFDD